MFSVFFRQSQPLVIEGRSYNGEIKEVLPSGKEENTICSTQRNSDNCLEVFWKVIEEYTGIPTSPFCKIVIIDPHKKSREEVYIENRYIPVFEDRIEANKEVRKIVDLFNQNKKKLQSVEVDDIFRLCNREKIRDFSLIEIDDSALIKYKGEWHFINAYSSGVFMTTFCSSKLAFKYLKDTLDLDGEVQDAEKAYQFLSRINPEDKVIGIEKRPVSPLKDRSCCYYGRENGAFSKMEEIRAVQIEKRFPMDLYSALKSNLIIEEEIPSLIACLVQGSKHLLENGIYPLDVKPRNIAYLGRGKAEHVDLRGALERSSDTWINDRGTYYKKEGLRQEYRSLFLERDKDRKENLAQQVHIALLGLTCLGMLRGKPCEQKKVLTPLQKETLQKMIRQDPQKRPSIQEIQRVFPLDLIDKSTSLPKHPWE